MAKKRYSAFEGELVFQWVDRWFQLGRLLWDLFRFDETPSPPPPTEIDGINYQGLRFWFIDHESQFRPLWRDFYRSQDWVLRPDGDLIAEIRDAEYVLENAFFCWYGPENLYQLVHALDIQSGIDIWEPSEHRAWTAMMRLLNQQRNPEPIYW